jgi:hypothetical protein
VAGERKQADEVKVDAGWFAIGHAYSQDSGDVAGTYAVFNMRTICYRPVTPSMDAEAGLP